MKRNLLISLFASLMFFALLVSWFAVSSQTDRGKDILDNYGKRPADRKQAVKFHLTLELMTGNWNDVQKQTILRAINQPSKDLEADVQSAFTPDEAIAVFYNIGSVDISDLREIYSRPIGKSEIYKSLSAERQKRAWQMNFALGIVRYDLTYEQQLYLVDLASAMPMTGEQSVPWEARAVKLFTQRDVGRGLFATIGEDRCPGQIAAIGRRVVPQCVCTTRAGNWSCNDSCHGEGTCTVDPGNCGFLWLYDCNGMCDNSNQ